MNPKECVELNYLTHIYFNMKRNSKQLYKHNKSLEIRAKKCNSNINWKYINIIISIIVFEIQITHQHIFSSLYSLQRYVSKKECYIFYRCHLTTFSTHLFGSNNFSLFDPSYCLNSCSNKDCRHVSPPTNISYLVHRCCCFHIHELI